MITSSSLHPTPAPNQANQFVKHVNDLSNDFGYQFEFFCDHCQKSFISTYIPAPSGKTYKPQTAGGKVKSFLGDIGREIGGVVENGFNSIGTNNQQGGAPNEEAILKSERDAAYAAAQAEMLQAFVRCPKCGEWVCSNCWDAETGTCSRCVREQSYIATMGGGQPGMPLQAGMQNPTSFSQPGTPGTMAAGMASAGGAAGAAGVFNASAQQPQAASPQGFPSSFGPQPQPQVASTVECPSCHEMVPEMDYCGKCAAPLVFRPCPECGRLVEVKYPFCGWCGAAMEKKPRLCPNCSNEVPDKMKFCPECGTQMEKPEPEPETSPAPDNEEK